MKSKGFLAALGAAAMAVSASGAGDADIVRDLGGPHFGTQPFHVFVMWLIESGPGSQPEYLSQACFVPEARHATAVELTELVTPPANELVEPETTGVALPLTAERPLVIGLLR